MFKRAVALLLCFCLVAEQSGLAQVVAQLDVAAHLSHLAANILPQDHFRPVHLRYLAFDEDTDSFKLLLDKGDFPLPRPPHQGEGIGQGDIPLPLWEGLGEGGIEEETAKLMRYFHIGLALPNSTFWVNLRPDAPDNIIEDNLAQTDIGRIMLEADVQLKKDTAAFTSPDTSEGREYWDKLYQKAGELFGSEQVEIPTYTRPWIVPGEIIIRETVGAGSQPALQGRAGLEPAPTDSGEQVHGPSAYIYKATLKVMLEEDYLRNTFVGAGSKPALQGQGRAGLEPAPTRWAETSDQTDKRYKVLNEYSSELIRELIIPKITLAVNRAKRYAALRQVYYSLILAQWFKNRTVGAGSQPALHGRAGLELAPTIALIDSGSLDGLISQSAWLRSTYFAAYQKSFKVGEYQKQETAYTPAGAVIRRYTSGGLKLTAIHPDMVRAVREPSFIDKGHCVSLVYQGSASPLVHTLKPSPNSVFDDITSFQMRRNIRRQIQDEIDFYWSQSIDYQRIQKEPVRQGMKYYKGTFPRTDLANSRIESDIRVTRHKRDGKDLIFYHIGAGEIIVSRGLRDNERLVTREITTCVGFILNGVSESGEPISVLGHILYAPGYGILFKKHARDFISKIPVSIKHPQIILYYYNPANDKVREEKITELKNLIRDNFPSAKITERKRIAFQEALLYVSPLAWGIRSGLGFDLSGEVPNYLRMSRGWTGVFGESRQAGSSAVVSFPQIFTPDSQPQTHNFAQAIGPASSSVLDIPAFAYNVIGSSNEQLQSALERIYKSAQEYAAGQKRNYIDKKLTPEQHYAFLNRLGAAVLASLRPANPGIGPVKCVYNPLGGFDTTGFGLWPDVQDVVSVGLEQFGPPQDIASFLNSAFLSDKALSNYAGYDGHMNMLGMLEYNNLSGLGAMAIIRAAYFLQAKISRLSYFEITGEGKIRYLDQAQTKDASRHPNAVLEFRSRDPDTGKETVRRFWHISHDYNNLDAQWFVRFINRLSFQALMIKGALDIFGSYIASQRRLVYEQIIAASRKPDIVVVSDRAQFENEPQPIFDQLIAAYFPPGFSYGYSSAGEAVYFSLGSWLIQPDQSPQGVIRQIIDIDLYEEAGNIPAPATDQEEVDSQTGLTTIAQTQDAAATSEESSGATHVTKSASSSVLDIPEDAYNALEARPELVSKLDSLYKMRQNLSGGQFVGKADKNVTLSEYRLFLHKLVNKIFQSLGRNPDDVKRVFLPFGGGDVAHGFWGLNNAREVFAFGIDDFSSPADIQDYFDNLDAEKLKDLSKYYPFYQTSSRQHTSRMTGLGAMALARTILFLNGNIRKLLYFEIAQDGKPRFLSQAEVRDNRACRNAVIEFMANDSYTGQAVVKRFWYIQHDIYDGALNNFYWDKWGTKVWSEGVFNRLKNKGYVNAGNIILPKLMENKESFLSDFADISLFQDMYKALLSSYQRNTAFMNFTDIFECELTLIKAAFEFWGDDEIEYSGDYLQLVRRKTLSPAIRCDAVVMSDRQLDHNTPHPIFKRYKAIRLNGRTFGYSGKVDTTTNGNDYVYYSTGQSLIGSGPGDFVTAMESVEDLEAGSPIAIPDLGPRQLSSEGQKIIFDKYGSRLQGEGKVELKRLYKIGPGGHESSASIRWAEKGQVIDDGGARYCNYVIVLDKESQRGALIHADDVNSAEFAGEALSFVLDAWAVPQSDNGKYMAEDIRVCIVKPAYAETGLGKDTENSFIAACNELGLTRLSSESNRAWYLVPVKFLPEEGMLLAVSEDNEIIHYIDLYEEEKKPPRNEIGVDSLTTIAQNQDTAVLADEPSGSAQASERASSSVLDIPPNAYITQEEFPPAIITCLEALAQGTDKERDAAKSKLSYLVGQLDLQESQDIAKKSASPYSFYTKANDSMQCRILETMLDIFKERIHLIDSDTVKIIAEALKGDTQQRALSLDILAFVVLSKAELITPDLFVALLEGISASDRHIWISQQIVLPLFHKRAELFTAEVLTQIAVKLDLRYVNGWLLRPKEFRNYSVIHGEFENLMRTGKKRVLIMHNLKYGLGDELIATGTLIQALLEYNKDLEVVIYTHLGYLYNHPRVEVRSAGEAVFNYRGSFDMVVCFAHHWVKNKRLAKEFGDYMQTVSPSVYIRSYEDEDTGEFAFGIDVGDLHIDEDISGNLYSATVDNVYIPFLNLWAILGLPLSKQMHGGEQSFPLGQPYPKAEEFWENKVKAKNSEGRKVALFNGFGGENEDKGYRNNEAGAEGFASKVRELVEEGFFVLIMPNTQPWGEYNVAENIVQRYLPDIEKYILICPSPSEDPLLPKYIVSYVDAVLTVEGGLMHLACLMGKVVRIMDRGGNWFQIGRWLSVAADISQGPVADFSVGKDIAKAIREKKKDGRQDFDDASKGLAGGSSPVSKAEELEVDTDPSDGFSAKSGVDKRSEEGLEQYLLGRFAGLVDVDLAFPQNWDKAKIIEGLKGGKVLRLKYGFPNLDKLRRQSFSFSLFLEHNLGIVNVEATGYVIHEVLKNAFVHGNKCDLSLPVFFSADFASKEIRVIDSAKSVSEDELRQVLAKAKYYGLGGSHRAITKIIKYGWDYKREEMTDSVSGNRLGTAAVISPRISSPSHDMAPGGIDLRSLSPSLTPNSQLLTPNALSASSPLTGVGMRMTGDVRGMRDDGRGTGEPGASSRNLNHELRDLEHLIAQGVIPAIERIEQYASACCQAASPIHTRDQALACISEILRLQEDYALPTEPRLKELLTALEMEPQA